jgi:hypothetical protein
MATELTLLQQCERVAADGSIPVRVTLCKGDVTSAEPPEPLYVCVPRSSYLCCLWATIARNFGSHVADFGSAQGFWVEHAGQPLPWHYPAGAVADTLGPAAAWPLVLTAHAGEPPKKAPVLPIRSKKDLTVMSQHAIKATATLLFPDEGVKGFYRLSPKMTQGLSDFGLTASPAAAAEMAPAHRDAVEELFRLSGEQGAWVVVVHRGGRAALCAAPAAAGTTFADCLVALLPDAMGEAGCNLAAHTAGGDGDVAALACELQHPTIRGVLVDGVSPLLSTPLQWLCRQMAPADLALHIVVLE